MERIVMREWAAWRVSNETSDAIRSRRVVRAALFCGLWLLFAGTSARADDRAPAKQKEPARATKPAAPDQPNGPIGPLSPEASLTAIRVHEGFQVELVAAEPLVQDPVAFEWGADGKLWVVEMADYPRGVDGRGKPGGRVKFLEDTKGDGRYDKATLFLDHLNYPNGVLPWGKGVLVTAAPDILYAEDTNGDGRADLRQVLYHGFSEGNQQHRVNGLVRGLDRWIYCANGQDSRGSVTSTKTGQSTRVGGRDILIRPQTGEIDTELGASQFLRSRNDWGDWFGNDNTNPLWQYVLEDRYVRRNVIGFSADGRRDVSVKPGPSRVYAISRPERRFNDPAGVNHFTSACSAIIYGDDLFGPEFAGNSFVSEPVHNLVHREVLSREGIFYTSQRAPEERESEFLASRENTFRPTTIKVGPDGALYVAAMCRAVIEHPQYIPQPLQRSLDFRAGSDRGRIYRVSPKGTRRQPVPKLATYNTANLVAALDSPHVWQRDTAQALLIERHDPAAAAALEALAAHGRLPQGRLHALATLAGLDALEAGVILRATDDSHWAVRRLAVRLAEKFFKSSPPLRDTVLRLVDDRDPAVQLQVAYSLGVLGDRRALDALARLALAHENEPAFVTAVLSSTRKETIAGLMTRIASDRRRELGPTLAGRLLEAAVLLDSERAIAGVLTALTSRERVTSEPAIVYARLAVLTRALDQIGKSLDQLANSTDADLRLAVGRLEPIFVAAHRQAADPKTSELLRVAAVRLLGQRQRDLANDRVILAGLVVPQNSAALQLAAVEQLGEIADNASPSLLLAHWKSHVPAVRERIVEILSRRHAWIYALLLALENHSVNPGDIGAVGRLLLLRNADDLCQPRLERVFAPTLDPNRQRVIDRYESTRSLPGDAARGKLLFAKHCGTCHKLGDVGQNVGPNLAARKDKSPESLLVAVLDPNRNVEARYVAYVAVTRDGRTFTGILADESASGLTLVGPKGERTELLRSQIEDLASTSKSLMPDGLEKDLSPQSLADLFAFIQRFDATSGTTEPARSSDSARGTRFPDSRGR
jgi:putative membrane-bound dehydrogenase-like protein